MKVSAEEALDALAVLFNFYDRSDIKRAGEELQDAVDEAKRRNRPQMPTNLSDHDKRIHRMIMAHRRARLVLERAGRLR